ncbi:MAG: hypothetical protein NVSMB14_09220 [Isosphaeraceae bacterium]
MLKARAFRPDSIQPLEDRSLPSGFAFFVEAEAPTPAAVAEAAAVQKAFLQFLRQFDLAVHQVLAPPGTINPSANAAAFQSLISQDLSGLNNSLTTSIVNFSNSTTVALTVQGQVTGSGPTSLASSLAAIPLPTSDSPQAIQGFILQADQRIAQSAIEVASEVAPTPAISTVSVARQDVEMVHRQIETFSRDYVQSARPHVVSKGPITPSALQAITTPNLAALKKSLSKTLAGLPNSQGVDDRLDSILLVGSKSLRAVLATIPLPTAGDPASSDAFAIATLKAIRQADYQIIQAISGAAGMPVDSSTPYR